MNKTRILEREVSIAFSELIKRTKGKPYNIDTNLVEKAFNIAYIAHGGRLRASNEPYMLHPLGVANIVTDLGMDTDSIVIALLHDVMEGNTVTYKDIHDSFGGNIADMVQGLTKLNYIENKSPFPTKEERKAKNYQNLLCATSKDARVLIVKLADRLHNMQNLAHISDVHKRRRVARETLEIYAALAERMGIRCFKEELQSLAFVELYPKRNEHIRVQVNHLKEGNRNLVSNIENDLKNILSGANLDFIEVSGREKKPYSIWQKIRNKKISFKDISDIFAFRIIIKSKDECYRVLAIIHNAYRYIQKELKDYISTSKTNGYQSLHTIVITPDGIKIEVQIRSEAMHQIAEFGSAAHWKYKQDEREGYHNNEDPIWVNNVLTILQSSNGAREKINNLKLEISYHQLFCFTPKGKLIILPEGATVLDFAFYIQLGIGLKCIGAAVDRRRVDIHHKLKHGDQVEIHCANEHQASKEWYKFLYTGRARAALMQYLDKRK